jgi:REP element-mobilizing transposase RayT
MLVAAHVRPSHVHAVLEADRDPDHVMTALKAYASRTLNALRLDEPGRRRWARHGSTRYLWTASEITAATHYVLNNQGQGLAVYWAAH